MTIKTRVAPSPTGFIHIWTVRVFLHNYLFAKKNNGTLLLRIEDTDQNRKIEGAVEDLIQALKTFGLDYDEWPYKDQGNWPYFQSQRLSIYKKHLDRLIDEGKAYYCFCSPEKLTKMREEQLKNKIPPKYNRACRSLTTEEIQNKLKNNEPYVIRLKIPDHQIIEFEDLVAGKIKVNSNEIDDQVLWKADGFPTYFGAIMDDYLMGITHVIRGNEWLTSTPKQILLYQALGFPLPKFAHPGNVLKEGGKKMSKRDGDASANWLLAQGYLVEALINFLILTGWNPGTNQEFFTLEELKKVFSLERVHKAGAFFDKEKLNWMNSEYIKKMSNEEYLDKLKNFINHYQPDFEKQLEKVVPIFWQKIALELKTRLITLSEFKDLASLFFREQHSYDLNLFINPKMKINSLEEVVEFLKFGKNILENLSRDDYQVEKIKEIFLKKIVEHNYKNGQILWTLRVALSGEQFSPWAFELAYIFGQKETLLKLNQAMDFLNKHKENQKN